jgi:multimeric flavodoxin WrbA
MKIVALFGDRKAEGVSSAVAYRFLQTAERLTAEIQTFKLNELNYTHCQACHTCKSLDECVLKDDLTEAINAVRDSEVLVLVSPIHYGDLADPVKIFIERIYCFVAPDFLTSSNPSRLEPGKKLVYVLTQEQHDESQFANVYQKYDQFFRWCGFHDNHVIRATGISETSDVEAYGDVLGLAEEMARRIVA